MTPAKFFLTKGVGVHKDYLASFELALRDADIEQFNLVTVSSILPPACKRVAKAKGLEFLSAGEIVFVVMARNATKEPNRLVSTSYLLQQIKQLFYDKYPFFRYKCQYCSP